MHKLKTVLELEKIDGVHVYIDENTDCIRIPAEWAEELEKLRSERIKEAQEMLVGINDVHESNDLQQRKRKDNVNHPAHYTQGKVEVIEFIEQVTKDYNANVAYHIGNAIKYLARSPHKNGKEDIAKAKWYLERAFERWEG
ncbi:hypothetical protein BUZ59_04380 [Staphylococcus kloosii]|nr:hypothetical protein BUZ59_04380 [Staphylococcus kloosii]